MKIQTHVQLVQHLQPGGIESMALDLCAFASTEQKTLIVSLEGDKVSALKHWPRLNAYADSLVFLNKPAGVSLKTLWRLVKFFKKQNVTRVHTHHIGPLLYGSLAAKIAGVKEVVHTEHDAWHLNNEQHRRIVQFCFQFLRPLVVADAKMVAEQLTRRIPSAKPHVIYNGVDTARFCPGDQQQARATLGLPQTKQLLGCAARLHPVKGHAKLVRLISRAPCNMQLVLAGDGEMKTELQTLVKKLGVEDRVHFLGNVDDMPNFYRAIDVFCLASDFEGLPLSPLEAQACNTPAIVTDVGGCAETVCSESGFVVPADDETALQLAVAKAFLNLGNHTPREFVQARYDICKMLSNYNDLSQACFA